MKKMTEVMTAQMIMFRGVGYKQIEVAKKLGVTAGTISYQLKRMRKLAEEHGSEDLFRFYIKALDFTKLESES